MHQPTFQQKTSVPTLSFDWSDEGSKEWMLLIYDSVLFLFVNVKGNLGNHAFLRSSFITKPRLTWASKRRGWFFPKKNSNYFDSFPFEKPSRGVQRLRNSDSICGRRVVWAPNERVVPYSPGGRRNEAHRLHLGKGKRARGGGQVDPLSTTNEYPRRRHIC